MKKNNNNDEEVMEKSSVPTGKFARGSVAGVAAAKIGAKKLTLLSKKPFMKSASFEIERKKHDDEVAQTLFKALTQLRGTALKMAQILSLEMGLLPEAYRKELKKSHYQVPPLNRAVVRKLLISEFGKEPESVFQSFESEAFAAASLGQVHRAVSHQQEKLGVKVQYPGIGKALKNDLEILKNYLVPLFRSDFFNNAMKEIEGRLIEEIDYGYELKNTKWFYENIKIEGIKIPKVFENYSSKFVITTELIGGHHLDQWLKTGPSQEKIDRAAQLMWDLFNESFFNLARLHTDPNPGNYLFQEDGSIGLIDFGSVKVYERDFTEKVEKLWCAHIRQDTVTVREVYGYLGISGEDFDKIYLDYLKPFGEWLSLPFRSEYFDFKKHSDYSEAGIVSVRKTLSTGTLEGFTTENIMFDRNIHGLFRIFEQMGARVKFRSQWLR